MTRPWPVALTGLGCICALGDGLEACMDGLFRGKRAPAPPVRFTSSHPAPYPVFEIADFQGDPALLRTSSLALHAAREALADARLGAGEWASLRVGVCVGTTVGSTLSDEAFTRDFRAGRNPDPAPIDRILRSNPALALAREFGFAGPCQTVVNACSSGTDAVGIAASWIRDGLCDVALAGGADELSRITYNGFIALKICSPAPCTPFDAARRGLNLGEGAAMLVLELEETRRRRGREPRTRLLGYGGACDAHHLTAPHPEGAGLRAALAEALACCRTSPAELAFVNAHGTGTRDNDRVESAVLSRELPGVPFLSTKGYTGHTLGAAGAIEAVFTAACLERGRIPASIGFETQDPECPAAPVREATPIRGARALSQSLAFGGNNAVIILGE